MTPADILKLPSISKEDLKTIIKKSYEIYGRTEDHQLMEQALLSMVDTNHLFWSIQYYIREMDHNGWSLAVIFAEDPYALKAMFDKNITS